MRWFNTYTYKRSNDRQYAVGSAQESAKNATYLQTGKSWIVALTPSWTNERKRFNASNYPDRSPSHGNDLTAARFTPPGEMAPPSLYHRVGPAGARARRRRFR